MPPSTGDSQEQQLKEIEVRDDAVYEVSEGARLHFIKFETKHIDRCLDYISRSLVASEKNSIIGKFVTYS